MKVQFNVVGFQDRRTKAQLESARVIEQERADQAIEGIWRARVAENVQRRLDRKVKAFIDSPAP